MTDEQIDGQKDVEKSNTNFENVNEFMEHTSRKYLFMIRGGIIYTAVCLSLFVVILVLWF